MLQLKVYLYIYPLSPSSETQMLLSEAIMKFFILSFESWMTDRKPDDAGREVQFDVAAPSHINSPLCLIAALEALE